MQIVPPVSGFTVVSVAFGLVKSEMNQSSRLHSFGEECVIFTSARKAVLCEKTNKKTKKIATDTFTNNSRKLEISAYPKVDYFSKKKCFSLFKKIFLRSFSLKKKMKRKGLITDMQS